MPERQFSGMDSAFYFMESGHAPLHGAFLQTYAPVKGVTPVQRFARLLKLVESQLYESPVFYRRAVRTPLDLDHPYWLEDTNIDLDYHVRHTALPAPGNFSQLSDAYSRINAQPLDMNRPLWEIHIVEGLNALDWAPKGSFALVIKFHHSVVDGVTGTEITSALHDENPVRRRFKHARPAAQERDSQRASIDLPRALAGSIRAYTRFNVQLGKQITVSSLNLGKQFFAQSTAGTAESNGSTATEPKTKTPVPRTLFNDRISRDRSYTHVQLRFSDIAKVRKAVPGATVNDVILAVCGGGLNRYLRARGALPGDSLVAVCPVNVRTKDQQGQAGNQFSVVRPSLHSNVANPLERLQRVSATMRLAVSGGDKRAGKAKRSRGFVDIASSAPGSLIALLGNLLSSSHLMANVPPLFNLCITNVPGPKKRLYLDGAELLDMNGCPPVMDGAGLIMAVSSYCDHLTMTAYACRKMMPEPDVMRSCLIEAFAELQEAARSTGKKRAKRGSKS